MDALSRAFVGFFNSLSIMKETLSRSAGGSDTRKLWYFLSTDCSSTSSTSSSESVSRRSSGATPVLRLPDRRDALGLTLDLGVEGPGDGLRGLALLSCQFT